MSLAEAVLEIAEEMEDSLGHFGTDHWLPSNAQTLLSSWAKQLRRAVKASGQSAPAVPNVDPAVFHRMQIEAAKAEFRKDKPERVDVEEEAGGRVAELDGTGDFYPIDQSMPIGAKIFGPDGKTVFQLRDDGKLHKV